MPSKVKLKTTEETQGPLEHGDFVEINYATGEKRYGIVHAQQWVTGVVRTDPLPLHVIYLSGAGWDKLTSLKAPYVTLRKLKKGEVLTLEIV